MCNDSQHYVRRYLMKGFCHQLKGIGGAKKDKTWLYEKGKEPDNRTTATIGEEDGFYGEVDRTAIETIEGNERFWIDLLLERWEKLRPIDVDRNANVNPTFGIMKNLVIPNMIRTKTWRDGWYRIFVRGINRAWKTMLPSSDASHVDSLFDDDHAERNFKNGLVSVSEGRTPHWLDRLTLSLVDYPDNTVILGDSILWFLQYAELGDKRFWIPTRLPFPWWNGRPVANFCLVFPLSHNKVLWGVDESKGHMPHIESADHVNKYSARMSREWFIARNDSFLHLRKHIGDRHWENVMEDMLPRVFRAITRQPSFQQDLIRGASEANLPSPDPLLQLINESEDPKFMTS